MTTAFGRELTIGVEEELFLVDGETFDAAPLLTAVVPEPTARLKPELFQCLVETTTPVCETAAQVHDELRCLREEVARRADAHGARVLAAASHPFARSHGQPIVPGPRYVEMVAEVGDGIYRQLVCGLHLHVGMGSADACLRAFASVVPWLPVVLSLSAASPFADGVDSGCMSLRAGRLAELPNGGAPQSLPSWEEWEALTAGIDYRRLWWDARPHPRLGTLEIRIADQQTDVRRSAGFAALLQALAAWAMDEPLGPFDRGLYLERRAAAARSAPDRSDVDALARLVEPGARALGGWPLVEGLLAGEPEALHQREVAAAVGLAGLVRELADRSLA